MLSINLRSATVFLVNPHMRRAVEQWSELGQIAKK